MIDVVAGFFLLAGALLALAASIALVRFPDVFSRMHAATKPQTLGLLCILVGLALRLQSVGAITTIVLIIAFQLLTAPVASHMVGRASHRIGLLDESRLSRNDLDD
ncbi:MAG: monovalent cation/H(+) antiporter subunit G [Aeromicrobium sp.]|uniref:monovalent cation/H(+) antiporter subunit G n=1 Tax=Aeromicrobium sp. TaxID=1871063 RepID=UPI002611CA69|nr:monovalent cation/H(+) antiporter subunit G [Aeromicrobium sp.]MDF1704729.1 monovalent cation/H(+) antiporter subunit G [Aeromicrobium sp.]